MNSKKLIGIIVSAIIFSLCAYYIIYCFQWHAISQLLVHVDWKLMPVAVIVTILSFWLLRTMRWFTLLKASGINVNFFHLYLAGSISIAFATITPFLSGEVLKVELLKKTGDLERIPGYGIFITERILDLLIVLLMAVLSTVFGVSKFLGSEIIFPAAGLLLICLLIFFIIIQRISPTNPIGHFFQPFKQCVRNGVVMTTVILLSIASWFIIILGWYACLRSISISINFPEMIALTTITTVIGILSLVPGALGISEVSISCFLVYLHQDITYAQAGALIIRFYGVMALILGFVHFFPFWKLIRAERQISTDVD